MQIHKNKKNRFSWGGVLRISLYLIACIIVIYAIPKESKFKYEYQKGSPWRHENLIAPFDFGIYKSAAELEQEKAEIEKNSKLYFIQNVEVQVKLLEKFLTDYAQCLEKNGLKPDTLSLETVKNTSIFHQLKAFIYSRLTNIYAGGTVDNEQLLVKDDTQEPQKFICVTTESITTQRPVSGIFTTKSAYLYLNNEIRKFFSTNVKKVSEQDLKPLTAIIESLQPGKWIAANLEFDPVTTQKVIEENINSISLTRGFVQKGQRIIYKGEVVGDEEFQILESMRKDYEQSNSHSGKWFIFMGQALFYVMIFSLIYMFLRTFRKEIFYQTKYSALILFLITFIIVTMSVNIRYGFVSNWIAPFLLFAIIIKTFFDTRTGMFLHITTCVAVAIILENPFEYFIMQFIAGYFLLMSYEKLNRRSQTFLTSVICFVIYTVVYISYQLFHTGIIDEINWKIIVLLAINSILLLVSYPLIYLFEKIFGLLSDVTLIELADSNRPLLRRLAEEAPGTFQHCMQVANLAEAAIFKIGGNPHLARTGALYHDIGKLTSPMYFTENQVTGINPHDKLDYLKSAEIIINHVIKGVTIAKEYQLPTQIIDFIKTHHGTSKAGYFYAMYKKEHPDENCDAKFTYPGPRPINKENAIVMMADSIEAASRSLKKYDTESIGNLVENIVNNQIANKQFDNTNLTFKDIDTVKELFKEKLRNIYHARIEYPK
ncbi:MAG: HDIG domain-containing protein [Bacteroidales bacterium]|nr:HDIG domain-containing protein [Bacteroidales bacterium]